MSDVIARAEQAKRVLDDPTIQKAFEAVRQQLLTTIEVSQIGDREAHHELALSLQAIRSVRRQLQKWVDDGDVERRRNPR
jgi:hypothetical protein